VLFGQARAEADRSVLFRSDLAFDAFNCMPGIAGAHHGGVEADVGRFRRSRLVPVPEVASLADLNETIERIDAAEDERKHGGRISVRRT
jgi:hypothetical protein